MIANRNTTHPYFAAAWQWLSVPPFFHADRHIFFHSYLPHKTNQISPAIHHKHDEMIIKPFATFLVSNLLPSEKLSPEYHPNRFDNCKDFHYQDDCYTWLRYHFPTTCLYRNAAKSNRLQRCMVLCLRTYFYRSRIFFFQILFYKTQLNYRL